MSLFLLAVVMLGLGLAVLVVGLVIGLSQERSTARRRGFEVKQAIREQPPGEDEERHLR